MRIKKIVSLLLVLIVPAVLFTGCSKKNIVKYGYNKNYKINNLSSQVVAQNDNLIMAWNDETKCVILENKHTGKIWSTVPTDVFEQGKHSSTLDISVQDMQLYQSQFVSSEELFESGKISCEKVKNGVKITYYFDSVEISVPVVYTLREDSLLVSVNGADIQEKGDKYRLIYVAPTPKLCSVTHDKENSYLFLPEGNGALMYTNTSVDRRRKAEITSANIASHSVDEHTNASESCGMRVFGIKDNNDAILAIAEDTPGAVGIFASAGDRTADHSRVYPVYYFVDYDYFYGKASNSGAVRHLSDRYQSTISVGFYPLENEDADYNGMAKRYREYLIDEGFIKTDKEFNNSPYAVTLLGGVLTTSSVAGFQVKSLKSMTSFNEAKEIIEKLDNATGIKPVVRLSGFTQSGINLGKLAGGFKFANELGNDKQRKALQNYCKDNDISIYTQFEMIKYSKSGAGFSYTRDSAKTAILYAAEYSGYNVPLRDTNSSLKYRLLKRSEIGKAVDKLIKTINKKDISGVDLSTLGEVSYSDYSEDIKYGVTGKMETDTKNYVSKLKKTGKNISGSAATYFAAGLIDTVFDAPLDKSGNLNYDVEIPFYQLVFSGVTSLYSSAVNLSSVPERKIMMAASTGTGLGFTLIKNYDKSYMEITTEKLYSCVFDKNIDLVKSALDSYSEIYIAINNSKIDRYELLENGISKTVFENGVVVYANNSSNVVESPVGELGAYEFKGVHELGLEREGI